METETIDNSIMIVNLFLKKNYDSELAYDTYQFLTFC